MSSKSKVSEELLTSLVENVISEKKNPCYSELNSDWQWGSDILEFMMPLVWLYKHRIFKVHFTNLERIV